MEDYIAKPVTKRARSRSAPCLLNERKNLIEDHYRVDTKAKEVLPGLPIHGNDWPRDCHDFFNLIILVPLNVLNIMCWNWAMILDMPRNFHIADAWTGEYFSPFFWITVCYFLIDLTWILLVPNCVRSPATIIQHHIATLFYLMVPYSKPHVQWCMGALMSVEINTWFLIARRVFNKQGFSPWVIGLPPLFSIRVKLISIFFYLSWISVRCILYPYMLLEVTQTWRQHSVKVKTQFNVMLVALPLQVVFCLLNMKWTYDLVMSKMRYVRRHGKMKEHHPSKGL